MTTTNQLSRAAQRREATAHDDHLTRARPGWRTVPLMVLGLVGSLLTACTSDGAISSSATDKASTTKAAVRRTGTVFADPRYGINFTYPKDWRTGNAEDNAKQSTANKPVARATIGLDDDNGIFVLRYDLAGTVPSSLPPEVATEVNGIVTQISGQPSVGTPTEIGGLPAIRYEEFPLLDDAAKRASRVTFLFDGNAEYEINCQSTPEGRNKVNQGCDQVLATLRKK